MLRTTTPARLGHVVTKAAFRSLTGSCLAGKGYFTHSGDRDQLWSPARHPWALHIAGCVWQSGQLRLLAGKAPKTPFWSRSRHRRPHERGREVSMHVGLVMECDYRDGRTQ